MEALFARPRTPYRAGRCVLAAVASFFSSLLAQAGQPGLQAADDLALSFEGRMIGGVYLAVEEGQVHLRPHQLSVPLTARQLRSGQKPKTAC